MIVDELLRAQVEHHCLQWARIGGVMWFVQGRVCRRNWIDISPRVDWAAASSFSCAARFEILFPSLADLVCSDSSLEHKTCHAVNMSQRFPVVWQF